MHVLSRAAAMVPLRTIPVRVGGRLAERAHAGVLRSGDEHVFARQHDRADRDRGVQQCCEFSVDTSHVVRGRDDRASAGVDDRF